MYLLEKGNRLREEILEGRTLAQVMDLLPWEKKCEGVKGENTGRKILLIGQDFPKLAERIRIPGASMTKDFSGSNVSVNLILTTYISSSFLL